MITGQEDRTMTLEMMEFGWWNILGIVVGGLANFFLGALWYMKLFNKRWIEAVGRTPEDFKDGSPGAGMLLTLGGCLGSSRGRCIQLMAPTRYVA
jgi:hypothetical protein